MSRRRKPPSRRPGTVRRTGHTRHDYPIYRTPPPFEGYREWFRVPAGTNAARAAATDPRLSQESKDLMATLVRLGQHYHGNVPIAAVHLDRHMETGELLLAPPDQPAGSPMATVPCPLDELVAIAKAEGYPAFDITAGIHEMHARGHVVLDDGHVLNLAIPPKGRGGRWQLSGYDTEGEE